MGNHKMEKETNLQKAQRINLILLKEIHRVCEKYGLKYYLICGGLLGAVRHQNFIPWDDDVDVAMTRHDFDILLSHVKDEWSSGDFMFVKYNEMGGGAFLDFFSRLLYMKEEVPLKTFHKIKGKGREDVQNHVPLDIYILENAPDDEKKFLRIYNWITYIYGLAMGHRSFVNMDEYGKYDEKMHRNIQVATAIGKWIPLKLLLFIYERIVRSCAKYEDSQNYFVSNGFIFCVRQRHPKIWFGEGELLPIGEELFYGPKMYHEELTFFYRDYMQLPPEANRKPDHVIEEE